MRIGKWIWAHRNDHIIDEYVEFFQDLDYSGGEVMLSISCDSNYALYINDKLFRFGQYPDYPHYKVYDRYDISSGLNIGKNMLKIIVRYYGVGSQTYYKGSAGLKYEVHDGNDLLAYSCAGVKCRVSPEYVSGLNKLITAQLGNSWRYDMCGRSKGMDSLGMAVEVMGADDLILRPVKPLVIMPTSLGKLVDPIRQIFDLGRERVGLLHVKLKADTGALIRVIFGEHLVDGQVRRIIGERDFSVEMIGNGESVEYINPFLRLGCRYLQLECDYALEVEFIGLKETLYQVRTLPYKADSRLRQSIYDTAVRTLELCMHDHYEDCPWREQAMYTLDSRNQMLCGYYAFGEYEFPKACLELIAQDDRKDGLLGICFPSEVGLTIPSFSLYYILQMYEYAQYADDNSLLIKYYDKINGIIKVFEQRRENGLVPTFFGDENYWNFYEWQDGLSGQLMKADIKRFDLILNTLFAYIAKIMSLINKRLGYQSESIQMEELAHELNAAVNDLFYDSGRGLYKTFEGEEHYCELGNALAVISGAAVGPRAERICELLADPSSGIIEATLSMATFKYDALLATDINKYREYVLNDIDTKYSYMLEQGATSFWETIKGESDFDGAGSLCHGWSAIPILYYHKLI